MIRPCCTHRGVQAEAERLAMDDTDSGTIETFPPRSLDLSMFRES